MLVFAPSVALAAAEEEPEITPAGLSIPVAPDQGDGLGVRKSNAVGGQAVIEGVMMRAKEHVATAVRAPDGKIVCRMQPTPNLKDRYPIWKKPVFRGVGMMYESLKLGLETLDWSAKIATGMEQESEKQNFWDKALGWIVLPIGLAAGLGIFLWLPYSIAKWTIGADGNQFLYHIVANSFRIIVLVGYTAGIAIMKDIRKVYAYHGAEHKAIATYEAGDPVEPARMVPHTRFHPRCGTSYLLVLVVVTMIFFSFFDATLQAFGITFDKALYRVLAHLPFVPLVAGLGYEVLKWSDRNKRIGIVALLIQPGLWMQRITTREPELAMLEVSATSLRAAITGVIEENDTVVNVEHYQAAA